MPQSASSRILPPCLPTLKRRATGEPPTVARPSRCCVLPDDCAGHLVEPAKEKNGPMMIGGFTPHQQHGALEIYHSKAGHAKTVRRPCRWQAAQIHCNRPPTRIDSPPSQSLAANSRAPTVTLMISMEPHSHRIGEDVGPRILAGRSTPAPAPALAPALVVLTSCSAMAYIPAALNALALLSRNSSSVRYLPLSL